VRYLRFPSVDSSLRVPPLLSAVLRWYDQGSVCRSTTRTGLAILRRRIHFLADVAADLLPVQRDIGRHDGRPTHHRQAHYGADRSHLRHRGRDHHVSKALVKTVCVIEKPLELLAAHRDDHDVGAPQADDLEVSGL
jgi:hypothetical protein